MTFGETLIEKVLAESDRGRDAMILDPELFDALVEELGEARLPRCDGRQRQSVSVAARGRAVTVFRGGSAQGTLPPELVARSTDSLRERGLVVADDLRRRAAIYPGWFACPHCYFLGHSEDDIAIHRADYHANMRDPEASPSTLKISPMATPGCFEAGLTKYPNEHIIGCACLATAGVIAHADDAARYALGPEAHAKAVARGDKHGPGGSGLRGPCEPDCAKCATERERDPGEAKRLRALHCSCLCHLSGSPTEHAPTEYGGVHGACIRAESQAAASVLFDTPSPIARCACCGVKDETRGVPDPIGWMIIDFPAGSPREEEKRLCTLCGEKVAKFIAHLSTPMLGDEDMP